MAANYYYGFGHGGSQFSLSSNSYPGGYSGPSNSRGQQQIFGEQHSQLPYSFVGQLEQNSGYGENKGYFPSTSGSSYPSSSGDDPKYNIESKYQQKFQPQTSSLGSDHSSYLSGMASKSLYSGPKTSDWNSAGPSDSNSNHDNSTSDITGTAQSPNTSGGFDSPLFKANSSSYYRNLTAGNQAWNNATAPGRKLLPFGSRPKPRQPPKPSQLHYCDVCRISCAGSQTYLEHLEGKNHKKKEAQSKAPEAPSVKFVSSGSSSGLRQLYCQLCDVACTGADTYAAHIRGAKHQKVLNLHTKLGKPIPDVQSSDVTSPRGDGAGVTGARKVAPARMNFVGGSQLSAPRNIDDPVDSESADVRKDEIEILDEDADLQPVGLEYIEEGRNETGSAVSFRCKLCECNFTDPLAKVMHTKGRRHRLNYKEKVDPSLQVSTKPSTGQKYRPMSRQMMKAKRQGSRDAFWKRRYYDDPYRQEVEELRFEKEYLQWQLSHALERYDWLAAPYPSEMLSLSPVYREAPETQDDRHVKAKHAGIYPTEEDLAAVQSTVSDCESTLKFVSDLLAAPSSSSSSSELENSQPISTDSADDKANEKEALAPAPPVPPRELKAVVRVGALSKGLLLHGDLNLELIVLCNTWPTRALLDRVMTEFVKQLNVVAPQKYNVSLSPDGVELLVTSLAEPKTTCSISLTALSVKGESTKELSVMDDRLDQGKCLASLAALRHAKWFQAKASSLSSCVILVRIMKDLCERITTWNPLSHWALELLAEKCLSSCDEPVQPGAGLRRVLECISSGLFLPGGPGLHDPCEKEPRDVLQCLTAQQKEDITVSAQHALRLLALGRIHQILGMDPLPCTGLPAHRRKRQRASDGQAQQGNGVGDQPLGN